MIVTFSTRSRLKQRLRDTIQYCKTTYRPVSYLLTSLYFRYLPYNFLQFSLFHHSKAKSDLRNLRCCHKKTKELIKLTTTDRYSSEGHQHNITNENTESKQNMACHFNSSSTLVFCLQGVMSKIKLRVCHTGLGFWLSLKGMDNNDQRRYPKRFMMYGCEIPSLRLCFRLAVRLL